MEIKSDLFNKSVKLNELRFHNTKEYRAPEFSHYNTGVYQSANGSVNLGFEGVGTGDEIVFYKSAANQASLMTQIWTQEKSFKGNKVKINSATDRFFQFLIIYKINSTGAYLTAFNVK